jgi:hypothetical protein
MSRRFSRFFIVAFPGRPRITEVVERFKMERRSWNHFSALLATLFFTLAISVFGASHVVAQQLAAGASVTGSNLTNCVVNTETSAVCSEQTAFTGFPKAEVSGASGALANYGFIEITGLANASPTGDCMGNDLCEGAVLAQSSGVYNDAITVVNGPGTGTLQMDFLAEGGGAWNCVGETVNGITGPDGGCGAAGVEIMCCGGGFTGQVPGPITVTLPISPGTPSVVNLSLIGGTSCGVDNLSACYSNYVFSIRLIKITVFDSNGNLLKGASLSAASSTNYNPILEGFKGDDGPVIVPPLGNATVPLATETAHLVGLKVETGTAEISATVPAGSVISQSPPAGTQLSKGSNVSLVVSQGPNLSTVPKVVHLPLASAVAIIAAAGLEPGTVTNKASSKVAAGSVISQKPKAGGSVATPSNVNLVVSSGPPGTVDMASDDEVD